MRNLKAVGGHIATSIYGRGKYSPLVDGKRTLSGFKLESLDFAPPSRAALGLAAVPHVTSEMHALKVNNQESHEMTKEELIQEMLANNVTPQRDFQPGKTVAKLPATQVSEMQSQLSERDDRITVLETTVQEFRRREFERAIDAVVAEMTDWPVRETAPDAGGKTAKDKLAALRAMFRRAILDKMNGEQNTDNVAEMAAAAWEEIKPIAEMMRDALAGPAAIVNGKVRATGIPQLVDTPETRAAAANSMGIQI